MFALGNNNALVYLVVHAAFMHNM